MRRREFITLLGGAAAAWPRVLPAQPSGKTYQIGFLGVTSRDANYQRRVDALRTGLRQLGYEESRNVVIHYRWAEGRYERLSELAAELVKLDVDVLVTHSTPGALAAKKATSTIPIVAYSGDPVAAGLVATLARPGGNLTGMTFFFAEICAKAGRVNQGSRSGRDPRSRSRQSGEFIVPPRFAGHAAHGRDVGRGANAHRGEDARRNRCRDREGGRAPGFGARGHRRPGDYLQRQLDR
jgi:hypothetical protein